MSIYPVYALTTSSAYLAASENKQNALYCRIAEFRPLDARTVPRERRMPERGELAGVQRLQRADRCELRDKRVRARVARACVEVGVTCVACTHRRAGFLHDERGDVVRRGVQRST